MPNLRPVTEEGGEAKINITPQLINEIFEEYPRVKIAFEKNVPNKVYYTCKLPIWFSSIKNIQFIINLLLDKRRGLLETLCSF
jgi:hypothetical protein